MSIKSFREFHLHFSPHRPFSCMQPMPTRYQNLVLDLASKFSIDEQIYRLGLLFRCGENAGFSINLSGVLPFRLWWCRTQGCRPKNAGPNVWKNSLMSCCGRQSDACISQTSRVSLKWPESIQVDSSTKLRFRSCYTKKQNQKTTGRVSESGNLHLKKVTRRRFRERERGRAHWLRDIDVLVL